MKMFRKKIVKYLGKVVSNLKKQHASMEFGFSPLLVALLPSFVTIA
jgi:hypothetical protein